MSLVSGRLLAVNILQLFKRNPANSVTVFTGKLKMLGNWESRKSVADSCLSECVPIFRVIFCLS